MTTTRRSSMIVKPRHILSACFIARNAGRPFDYRSGSLEGVPSEVAGNPAGPVSGMKPHAPPPVSLIRGIRAPVDNIILALNAILAVRKKIEFLCIVDTGGDISVFPAPGIERYSFFLQVWTIPADRIRRGSRLLKQGPQSLFRRWILAVVQFIQIQRGGQIRVDIRARGRYPRLLAASGDIWDDHRGQDADNNDDEHDLDECKSILIS